MRSRKYLFFILTIVAVLIGYVILFQPFDQANLNQLSFEKSIKNIKDDTPVSLTDLTNFKWDSVYTFIPYTQKEKIETIIGFKSNNIQETVSEGMTQLLFVYNNKVVCSICGYLEYTFDFGKFDDAFIKLDSSSNPVFNIDRTSNLINFIYKK